MIDRAQWEALLLQLVYQKTFSSQAEHDAAFSLEPQALERAWNQLDAYSVLILRDHPETRALMDRLELRHALDKETGEIVFYQDVWRSEGDRIAVEYYVPNVDGLIAAYHDSQALLEERQSKHVRGMLVALGLLALGAVGAVFISRKK